MNRMSKRASKMINQLAKCKIFVSIAATLLLATSLGCRSPLIHLQPLATPGLEVVVRAEDHTRNLKRLRAVAPGEANAGPARAEALEGHRAWLEAEFRAEARARGLSLGPGSDLCLELTLTSLGEVRARYIIYGILGGVAWGIGTGLIAHDPRLAIGLGLYELVEESAFWIAGSAIFGAYSAPVVLEAGLFRRTEPKAVWRESYYVLNGRKLTKGLPAASGQDRSTQLHASLRVALDKLFKDLEAWPGFPNHAGPPRPFAPALP